MKIICGTFVGMIILGVLSLNSALAASATASVSMHVTQSITVPSHDDSKSTSVVTPVYYQRVESIENGERVLEVIL